MEIQDLVTKIEIIRIQTIYQVLNNIYNKNYILKLNKIYQYIYKYISLYMYINKNKSSEHYTKNYFSYRNKYKTKKTELIFQTRIFSYIA